MCAVAQFNICFKKGTHCVCVVRKYVLKFSTFHSVLQPYALFPARMVVLAPNQIPAHVL